MVDEENSERGIRFLTSLGGRRYWTLGLVFSANGKMLIASSGDTEFWHEDENGSWHLSRKSEGYFVGFLSNPVVALLFPKSKTETWGWIELQNTTGAVLQSIACDHITQNMCYGYSPDEKWFFTYTDGGMLYIYDAKTLHFVTSTSLFPKKNGPRNPIRLLRFTPDGQMLFFISGAQLFRCRFETAGPTVVPAGECFLVSSTFRVGQDYQLSPTNELLALTNEKLFTVEVYINSSLHQTFSEPIDGVPYLLAFSPDGTYLACADDESNVSIWNVATGQLHHQFLAHPGPMMEQMSSISSLAWSPRGDILATGGSLYEINDYSIKLWKIEGHAQ